MIRKENENMEFREEHWKNMKRKLDEEMPVSFVSNRLLTESVFLIATIAAMATAIHYIDTKVKNYQNEEIRNSMFKTDKLMEQNGETPYLKIPEESNVLQNSGRSDEKTMLTNEITPANALKGENSQRPAESRMTLQLRNTAISRPVHTFREEEPMIELKESNIGEQTGIQTSSVHDEVIEEAEETEEKVAIPSPGISADGEVPVPPVRHSQLILSAGGNLSKGFDNTGEERRISIDPVIGMSYQRLLNERWRISIALFYMSRSKNQLRQESDQITYFFDKEISAQTATTEKLNLLHLSLKIGYNVKSRHRIYGGGYLNWIIDSKSRLETIYRNSSETTVLDRNISRGYNSGLLRINYGLSLEYQFCFSPRISAGFVFNWGINDLSKDVIYKHSDFDRIMECQALVHYHLKK